ncbi:mucin-2 [Cucumis melo var. makuwa]|uniref:Mucin-2 n=2 Tax=Cucumis melo TaxID=3656 RepID=A0A5D3CYQ2_CUCMM|nr:mucin-2 [Cucumis melo var. makuwa]
MRRRTDTDDFRPVNNTFQTITAAADAIATVDHRFPRATAVQKRRWGSCLSIYWCFGSLKQRKRIGHAVLVPEPSPSSEPHENTLQSPDIVLPFAAPPSSPVSLLQSEPPSAIQSPTALISFTSLTANMYSPDGPSSIFAIGPFAHEPQLVSPPLNFSTLTTEPSTPPFTPPESIHLTTPSSPEVPFAQFVPPSLQKVESDNQYTFPNDDFQSYQFYPGSPVSHLISPRSVISRSGASSPLPDYDFASFGSQFLNFPLEVPPTLSNLDKHSIHNWRQRQSTDSCTQDSIEFKSSNDFVLNPHTSESMCDHHATNESQNIQILIDDGSKREEEPGATNHRFSFELSDGDVLSQSVGSKPLESNELPVESSPIHEPFETTKENSPHGDHTSNVIEEKTKADGDEAHQHQEHHSVALGSVKEFNFDNRNGSDTHNPKINSDWWTNAKDGSTEGTTTGAWSFFPTTQQR